MNLADLQQVLSAADPAVVLVSPRVIERVIQEERDLRGIVWHVPHRKSYVVDRHVLFRFVEQDDLMLESHQLLPATVILLKRPNNEDHLSKNTDTLLLKYWRRIFHSNIHLVLENAQSTGFAVRECHSSTRRQDWPNGICRNSRRFDERQLPAQNQYR